MPFREQIGRTLPALDLPCKCSLVPRSWLPDLLTQRLSQPQGHENSHSTGINAEGHRPPIPRQTMPSSTTSMANWKRRTRPMGVPNKAKSIRFSSAQRYWPVASTAGRLSRTSGSRAPKEAIHPNGLQIDGRPTRRNNPGQARMSQAWMTNCRDNNATRKSN